MQRGQQIRITVDGESILAYEGETRTRTHYTVVFGDH